MPGRSREHLWPLWFVQTARPRPDWRWIKYRGFSLRIGGIRSEPPNAFRGIIPQNAPFGVRTRHNRGKQELLRTRDFKAGVTEGI